MPGCASQIILLPQCSDRGEDVSTPVPAEPHRWPHCSCHCLPDEADTGSWVVLERLGDAEAPPLQ